MRHYLTPWTSKERAEVPSLPFLAQEQVLSVIWTLERFGTHIVQPPIRAQGQQVVELPLQHLSSLKITTNEHSLLVGSSQHKPPSQETLRITEKAHEPSRCSVWKGRAELVGLVWSRCSRVPRCPLSKTPGAAALTCVFCVGICKTSARLLWSKFSSRARSAPCTPLSTRLFAYSRSPMDWIQ